MSEKLKSVTFFYGLILGMLNKVIVSYEIEK